MYQLTIFVLLSCVTSQRLVGAVRRGGSRSGRSNLYFDSYDRPSLQEFEESEDGLREAVLMHPEEVLDIPPIPVERDYETMDLDTDHLPKDYPDADFRESQIARGFIHDLLEQIQAAFSKWPPGLPSDHSNEPPTTPEFYFQFDSSLLETQQTMLKVLLATVEQKTCKTVVEKEESPEIIFMGTPGCSIEAVENKIIIGYECFEPTMILKLIFKLFGFCPAPLPEPTSKASGLYVDNFRSKMQREDSDNTDCINKFNFCSVLANQTEALPCSSSSHFKKGLRSRTCRICGDSCEDYDPNCNTRDTLKDCLLNWDQKKLDCASTCGLCKNRKESDYCIDYVMCCEYYAKRGYCPLYPKLMKEFCPLSCGYCKPLSCFDERNDCSELKELGGCTKMEVLMGKSCRRTCNLCRKEMENRDNEERNPPEDCNPDEDFMKKYCSWDPFVFN